MSSPSAQPASSASRTAGGRPSAAISSFHRMRDEQRQAETGRNRQKQAAGQPGSQPDRQTGRQAGRQAGRQTDRQTGRHKGTKAQRQAHRAPKFATGHTTQCSA